MELVRWAFKDRSLGYKITVLGVVPVIIVILFIAILSFNALELQMIDKAKTRAEGLLSLSVLSLSNSFVIYNKELLDDVVENLMEDELVVYAMVVDANDSRIMAHTDHLQDGKIYTASKHRHGPDMAQISSRLLAHRKYDEIYELSAPIVIKGMPYGVVRMGITFKTVLLQIKVMKNRVFLMSMLALVLGALVTVFLGRMLSNPIKVLAAQSRDIGGGDFEQKLAYESKDALGNLARAFNEMAEKLKVNIGMLEESESKYRGLFEYSPISLWEEDMSSVKKYLDNLRARGVRNLRHYFENHPEEISACINLIRIIDVNVSSLKMYEAESKDAFFSNLKQLRTEKTQEVLIQGIISLAEGKPADMESVYNTLAGREITVLVNMTIPPGYEDTWEKVFISVQDITGRKRAEFLEDMFGRYLSQSVMNTMIANPDSIRLGGEKRQVTIMMSDLRGFTAISERMEPEQVVDMLNNYFEIMVDIIRTYDGTIIEIVGDALLVLFGAPHETDERVQKAIACAIAMQNAMTSVTAYNHSRGFPELEMGIGLNDAEVVVGNIGSKKRSKYGVVGSGVNMTGRIESYTVGGQILVSESVRKEAGDLLRIDNKMIVHAKGAETSTTVYQVGGIGGRYNLAMQDKIKELFGLVRHIPIVYTVLEGKYLGEDTLKGTIIRLSRNSGEIRLHIPLEPHTNIKMNLEGVSEDLSGKDFYGKIIKGSSADDPSRMLVRFTALPPSIDGYIQAAIDQGGIR